jgi:hypothetical protein
MRVTPLEQGLGGRGEGLGGIAQLRASAAAMTGARGPESIAQTRASVDALAMVQALRRLRSQ